LKEEDVRPEKLFNELLRLNANDIAIYFKGSKYTKISCPACGKKGTFVFNKDTFDFDECKKCKTLYVSLRPDKESFDNYYTDSESSKFWATTFYKATQENRREKLWKPKALLINEKVMKYAPSTKSILDIGGGYGVFMEEYLKLNPIDHLVIEPSKYLSSICRDKKLKVLEKFLEDIDVDELKHDNKTFVSFELFEHLHNPELFLKTLYDIMDKEDIFIFTTLSGMGVDIQSLWEDSKSISPPMHLNFFNPKSVEILLTKVGFRTLEVTTPGKLDIDIMNNNKAKIKDRFWNNFIDYSNEKEKNTMQKFISENNYSSHMMIVCEKV
jgi:2-polyprenyl-3-methyl-5-hydroxy-6-metoxy-1,4-benzoquinol methylase